MFRKNYKDAMDNIAPNNEIREEILDKIILKEELKDRRNPAIPWRIAFACVACVALILGIVFVPRDNFKPSINNPQNTQQTLKVSKSYAEIYKLIKPKIDYNLFDGFAKDDMEIVYEEEYEYEYAGGSNNTSSPTSTNESGTLKGESANTDITASEKDENDFSTTTEQVEGVSEADIVKTDGEYIYYVNDTTLSIVKADGSKSLLVSQTQLTDDQSKDLYGEMFLKDNRLILLKTNFYAAIATNEKADYNDYREKVLLEVYDISDHAAPKKIAQSCQDGGYNSARMVGDYVYIVSNYHINVNNMDKNDPKTFVPTTETNGVYEAVPADSIYRYEEESYSTQYTVIGAFDYKDGKLNDTASLLGGTDNIYCSQGNIILADTRYVDAPENYESYVQEKTVVSKLEIKQGLIEYKTSGEVDGVLDNQFYIDEHNGYFRFVTTTNTVAQRVHKFENSENEYVTYQSESSARLTVLDTELKKVGEITDLAQGERVYSVRFMGDIAYFVTFRQTDPLFSADLSDPANPKILGELKIPGFSEYMYPFGDGLLLGFGMDADEKTGATRDLKLSMFNISDPANVTEQDKTIIEGYRYSPALSSHKAMLVHPGKKLIGFAVTNNWTKEKYVIYEYTTNGFERKAELTINEEYNYYAMTDIRGLFVNDSFYVVSDNAVKIFDINTFNLITSIDL